MLFIRSLRTFSLFAASLTLGSALICSRGHAEPSQPLEIHEWSVWVTESTASQINALANYPSNMPGAVDTNRSRKPVPNHSDIAPLSIIRFSGPPPETMDFTLKMTKGRFLAHWPPAENKNNRLVMRDLQFAAEPKEDAYAFVPESHWFHEARKLDSLQISRGARGERFVAYDPEVDVSLGLHLEGGPDQYHLTSAAPCPLRDVLLIIPSGQSYRLGWLDEVPAATGGSTKPADSTDGKATAPKSAKASAKSSKGAEAKSPGSIKESAVDITMGQPLSQESAAAQIKEELRKRLSSAGLKSEEIDLLLSLYAPAISRPAEALVLVRLPQATLDEWMPIETDPEVSKIVRVALVFCEKLDPRIRDQIKALVEQLGDNDYAKREEAESKLFDLGRAAIPALKEAAKGSDPERTLRAERLLLQQKEQLSDAK